jgi:hypothetical protein
LQESPSSLLGAYAFLKDRLASRSFLVLFGISTSLFLFDVFLLAYARVYLSASVQEKAYSVFGQWMLVGVYLGSILEALMLSSLLGYFVTKLRAIQSERGPHLGEPAP